MQYKSIFFVLCSFIACTEYAMQFQEDPQLRDAILRLDRDRVYNILNQRENYLSEEEFRHYTGILNQLNQGNYYDPDMESWAYFQNIYGPFAALPFGMYGIIGRAILDRWQVASPTTTLSWIKYSIWKALYYSANGSLGIAFGIGMIWLGSYVVIPYLHHRANRQPAVADALHYHRATVRTPVFPPSVHYE